MATLKALDVIFVNGTVLGVVIDGHPFLSVRGLLACPPEKRFVTVDMGAVEFVYNGADVMAPGVVDADSSIAEGDIIWVRDEKNHQPLAVGVALMSGSEMIAQRKGKAARTLHYVGDGIWGIDEG